MAPFLFDYAKKMNAQLAQNPDEVDTYRNRFTRTMDFVAKVFPFGFRRAEDGIATPRARFEAIAVGTFLAMNQNPNLDPEQIEVDTWINSKAFRDVTGSDGANAIARLQARIDFVRDRLLGIEEGR